MNSEVADSSFGQSQFPGFESLEANFVFCPNQFFDLVIPNQSRPVVRLIAYILHETLRWLDNDGQPVQQNVAISFNDLVEKAGIARGSIRKALGEAVNAGLIRCVLTGRAKSTGNSGQVGEYALNWDESGHYAKSMTGFTGFYVGQGNRSPIPHSFFTHVIPKQPLAVVKVVGTVLRHTVGYQNQYGGGRRSEAQLSFNRIRSYARIGSSATLADAMRQAINANFIKQIRVGNFSADSDQQSASVYGVNWLADKQNPNIGSKNESVDQFKKQTRASVQNVKQDQFNNQTRIGSETEPVEGFKKRSILNNSENNQQRTSAEFLKSIELLIETGFDKSAANAIAQASSLRNIRDQVEWSRYRTASTNKLGMLRKAIQEKWPAPPAVVRKRREDEMRQTEQKQQLQKQVNEKQLESSRTEWIQRWQEAPASIREKCIAESIKTETNPIVRKHLESKSINDTPAPNFLIVFKQLDSKVRVSTD